MERSKDDLGYTESSSRPALIARESNAGVSSKESKDVQDDIEKLEERAKSQYGRFYLENATETEF